MSEVKEELKLSEVQKLLIMKLSEQPRNLNDIMSQISRYEEITMPRIEMDLYQLFILKIVDGSMTAGFLSNYGTEVKADI